MTVNPREVLPTVPGRQMQAAIDAAERTINARKGFLVERSRRAADDEAYFNTTLANVFHRTIYCKETGPT